MHTIRYILFIFLFSSCASQHSIAQTDGSKKAQEVYRQANENLVFGKYEEATDGFNDAIKIDPNYIDAHLQLANLYQNKWNDYDQAALRYESVIKLDKEIYKAYYEAASCYMFVEEFDKAENYAKIFKENASLSATGKWQADLLVRSIAFSRKAVKTPVDYNPINLGANVNSELAEYFPSITADNEWLYFTVNNEKDRYPNEDIYSAQFVNGQWQSRVAVDGVNRMDSHEGAHSISQDGRYLFFASDRRDNNQGRFDIYIAKKVGASWKEAVNIGPVINTRYWDSQPVIAADSKELFVVRKSQDGLGGSDIYVATLTAKGGFSEPVNLGAPINTPGDEQRPYLHPDGKTLYFASNGHPGIGLADVYKSVRQADGSWSEPENLGFPINTIGQEFGLYVAADGKTAYISSDRDGGFGDMDLYSFTLPVTAQPELVARVKGLCQDMETKEAVKANIKIADIQTGEVYKTLSTDEIDGSFLITLPSGKNYVYQANADGYLPYSANFSVKEVSKQDVVNLLALMQKIEKGKEFVLQNIFFDTNAFQLKENSKTELNILLEYLEMNKDLTLEIGGHTDSDGAEAANLELSNKRAKAVYDYLISQGADAAKLSFKGYGESQPLQDNVDEESKAKNRRTAFKVL